MSQRIGRVFLVIVLGAGCFLLGYYNEPIQRFFFNKDALIGLLSAVLFGYICYSQFLEKKVVRLRHENSSTHDKLEEANSRFWNRKELKVLIKEHLTDLHKDLSTQISNVKADILLEMQKHVKDVKKK